jgi:Pyridoxamine 5'-phosphate oxidase
MTRQEPEIDHGQPLEVLDRDECVELLTHGSFLEVDESRSLVHSGWSVLVRGRAELVTDEADLAHLRAGPLRPWAEGARSSWVRIVLDVVSGRRIAPI